MIISPCNIGRKNLDAECKFKQTQPNPTKPKISVIIVELLIVQD